MKIVVRKDVALAVGAKAFEEYGIREEKWGSWTTEQEVNLALLPPDRLNGLQAMLEPHRKVKGVPVLLNDIKAWKAALEIGVGNTKARTVKQFCSLLIQYLAEVKGHRLYTRHTQGASFAYYVDHIEYHAPNPGRGEQADTTMTLLYEQIGGKAMQRVVFHDDDCLGISVAEAVAKQGYLPENEELRADYLENKELWTREIQRIGTQYLAIGPASTLKDDWTRKVTQFDLQGEPARVVMDVFFEDVASRGSGRDYVDHPFFWNNVRNKSAYNPKDDTWDGKGEDDENNNERTELEYPLHPWVRVFDLRRHERLQCHIRQLTEYAYDETLSEKLVLPDAQKELVKLLIDTKGGVFTDIVRGKSGGAIVLLSGEPGTGKTLTAEVYAESEKRPLYSIQCSQLGINPEKLESELMQVFTRAQRWNAVMLLDEADVYVRERGSSLQQNAIVGVFLRVLEYQATVLFLTTNRPNDVDDAIASRCIARIHFLAPDRENAIRIWEVLTSTAGIKMTRDEIVQVVSANPGMTGRDIKNILKLVSIMKNADKGITRAMVKYVQQFKPTGPSAYDKKDTREYVWGENGRRHLAN